MKDIGIKALKVKKWFDCGRVEVLLEANKYFLEKSSKTNTPIVHGNSIILPPSYIAADAIVENCVIGPYASVGNGVTIKNCVIKNSIISYKSKINDLVLNSSLIGKEVVLHGEPSRINIGEKSEVFLK